MRKFPYFLACMGFIAACSDGGTPSGGYGRPGIPGARPYENAAKTNNKVVTNMIVTNDAQVADNISFQLRGYTGTVTSDQYLDIANLAIQIADGTADFDSANADVLNAALYVITPELFNACGTAGNVATCVSDWRADNATIMNNRLKYLREWAEKIDISNAEFYSTANTNLKFTVDDAGNINAITVDDTTYNRIGNTNTFGVDNVTALVYDSAATGDLKLSYSDFGVYQIKNDNTWKSIPFAGGYESRRIADATVQTSVDNNLEFSGAAVGTVTNADNKNLDIRDDRVALTFDKTSGTSTLTADFANWYDIAVTKQMGDTTANIDFSNYSGTDDFRLPEDVVSGTANINMGYYGANPSSGIPTEATGTIDYEADNGIQMDVAFGVKR